MNEFIEKTNYREKKVASAEIIVTGTKGKPYFEIRYKEVGKEDYSIGYSSYDLNNVFGWKEECFEIINQLAEEYNNGWIACSDRLPEDGETVLVQDFEEYYEILNCETKYGVKGFSDGWWTSANNYLAWQPLPQPFVRKDD